MVSFFDVTNRLFVSFGFSIMKKVIDLAIGNNILGGHGIGINIHGGQPFNGIYVRKQTKN